MRRIKRFTADELFCIYVNEGLGCPLINSIYTNRCVHPSNYSLSQSHKRIIYKDTVYVTVAWEGSDVGSPV